MTKWLIVAAVGIASLIAGLVIDPDQAYFSYVTAYLFAIGIVLGALILVMTEELIAATWFVVFRRTAEAIASTLPVFVVLFIPVLFGMHHLYPWTHVETLDEHARGLVSQKLGYLNVPFFLIRAAVYFACWIAIAEQIRAWSLRQDEMPGAGWTRRIRRLSAPGLIVLGFTLTFAAIDWLMSLAPTWFSTIFGVQIFAGAMAGTLGLLAAMLGTGRTPETRTAERVGVVTPDHCSALGKMILTFVIFWAYTSFAQLLIIWIANIPDEAAWYIPRTTGAWLGLGLALAVAHFGVPFFLMLSYELKRRRYVLVRLGWWLLAAHYVDVYWMVMPQLHPSGARPHWLDVSAAATVIGVAVVFGLWRARGQAPLPIGDPELVSSLGYSET